MTSMHRVTATITVIIPAGTSESEPVSLGAYVGGILFIPDEWTAADLGFLVSPDGVANYKPLAREGDLVTAVVDPTQHTVFPEVGFPIVDFKLLSHNAGTPVIQTAERKIVIVVKS